MKHRRAWLLALPLIVAVGLASCGPKKPPPVSVESAALLEKVRARPVPDRLQARFQIKLRSKPLGLNGTTGGGVMVDRPGRGRIEIFGPLGGSLATLLADGTALAAILAKDRKHLIAEDAESVIRETTGGAAGVDDLLAVLIGDLPFDTAEVRKAEVRDGEVYATFEGPNGVVVDARLDPKNSTPAGFVARDAKGSLLLEANYEGWTTLDGQLLPQKVELEVPSFDLSVTVRYQAWKRPTSAMPPIDTSAPEGFASESMEDAIKRSVDALAQPSDSAEGSDDK